MNSSIHTVDRGGKMKGKYIIPLIVSLWIIQWTYYLLVGFDPLIHLAPYALLILALIGILRKEEKHSELKRAPLVSPLITLVLCFGVVFIYIISFSYPSMLWLAWNSNAIITIILAFYVSTPPKVIT